MGNRVEQGKPAVPTEAVAAAKSAAKQVSRVPVGKAVRPLTAKAGVLKKTTKKTSTKKTSAKKTTAKKTAARKPAAKKSLSRPAAKSRSERSRSADNQLLAGHLNPPHSGREVASCREKNQRRSWRSCARTVVLCLVPEMRNVRKFKLAKAQRRGTRKTARKP